MKYTYAYKTSDGVRHEDAMHASSREEVFEALRRHGIKAIKVAAADGSKANGEVRGVRKRMVVVLVALAAAGTGVIAYIGGERTGSNIATSPSSSPRHQIYGDPVTMEAFERGDFSGVLEREGDMLLAMFAQPGRFMCAKGVNPRRLDDQTDEVFSAYAKDELSAERDIAISPDEPREAQELKRIVNGIRDEMRGYLANGFGTPRSFWRRLNERTAEEMQIYDRTRRELEVENSMKVWEEKNDALRRLGIRPIAMPKGMVE